LGFTIAPRNAPRDLFAGLRLATEADGAIQIFSVRDRRVASSLRLG
jgi:hypothetical protein